MSLLKDLEWVGSSREDIKELPLEVMKEMGYRIYEAQMGEMPYKAKPLKGLDGIIEIICDGDRNTYRAVYAAKLGDKIYILHVFQKKSKTGIKTPKKEIELIKQRLNIAKSKAKSSKN